MTKTLRFLFLLGFAAIVFNSCNKEIDHSQPMPLDYTLQEIPDIHKTMPLDLLEAMKDYLHFGNNPPNIDTCFYTDSIRLKRFIHNTDIDPSSSYTLADEQFITNRFTYRFHDQHKGIANQYQYERAFGDISYGLGYFLFENATTTDSIFIMGNKDTGLFTAFFKQECKRRMEPDESLASYITDYDVERKESIILSGRVTAQGIADFHLGMRIESYTTDSPRIGMIHYLPQIHDIFIYDLPDKILPYDATFYQEHNNQ